MQALLGKITYVTRPSETSGHENAAAPLEIKFKPACLLPQRTRVPEWLKDQALTLRREVSDMREVGDPGDSLVLTPVESERWLYPLTVSPSVTYGELPAVLQLHLRWWKEEKLPEYTVRANGRSLSGQFAKEGEGGAASVETASFFTFEPQLPVTFEVICDKLKAACTVLPKDEPCAAKLPLPEGERYRIENGWYVVDVNTRMQGGGIEALREKGREIDHFRGPENLISSACEFGGHIDRYSSQGWDWADNMKEAALTCAGTRRQGEAIRVELEGVVDEGQNLRTSIVYTLYDRLPLLLLERDFRFLKGKGPDKDKEKDEKPKVPIDDMKPVRLGFRAAWRAEREGHTGSRVLCMHGDRLTVTRPGQVGEGMGYHYWRMSDGWVVAEHPGRREYTMYLFDPQAPPHLVTWLGEHTITLQPFWPHKPVRPDDSIGYGLGLTAGEICGAGVEGAWVACRTAMPEGGVRCGVISRLRDAAAHLTASISLASDSVEAPLEKTLIPGIGSIVYATADFPRGRMDQPLDAAIGSIARRR